MTKVTVLMTVYNGQRYIGCAIDSVLKQSYSDFEFLIIDDASNDGSFEIIKSYQDPRIRVIRNPTNQGQTASLNIGLHQARGDYIARIDADDIAFPHWLQSQVDFLEDKEAIDVLSAGLVTFGENGLGKAYFSPSCREDILLKAIIKSPVNHGGALMRKDTILKIGGYNSDYKIAADYGVWIKLLKQNGSIASNSDIVMAIRRHADSQSEKNKHARVLNEFAQILRGYIQFLTGMDLTEEESLLISRAHYDEGGLDRENFLRAIEIHRNVYASLKQDLNLRKSKVKFWYKKQARTFFLRRIYWHILKRDRLEARAAACQCLKKIGFRAVFAGLFILSFFPQSFLDFILEVHSFIHTAMAKLFLGNRKRYPQLEGLII